MIEIEDILGRVNADRIRPAPLRTLDATNDPPKMVQPGISPEQKSGINPERSCTITAARSEPQAMESPEHQGVGDMHPGPQPLPFVVDKVIGRGIDNWGRSWALVYWYNWPSDQNSWEPDEMIPNAIVSRFKRTYSDEQEQLECNEGLHYC